MAASVPEAREEELRSAGRHALAERVGRRVFQVVGLVHDDRVHVGEERRPFAAQREVGEQEVVVHHEQRRRVRAPAPRLVGAALVEGTRAVEAVAALGPDGVPDVLAGREGEVLARPRPRGGRRGDGVQLAPRVLFREQVAGP